MIRRNLVFALGLVLTAARLVLGCRIPVFLRGEYVADDFLMVRYAESLLEGRWLGDFRGTTLTKDAGYAVFLAVLRKLKIPYVFGNTLFYCVCVLLFCLAIYKLFPNLYACFALYVYLLFTPIMLNEDAIQKAYRAGFLSSVTLLLMGAVIGLYGVVLRGQHVIRMVFWSAVAAFALICFWFTKEDGIWLMPFTICGLLIAGGTLVAGWRREREDVGHLQMNLTAEEENDRHLQMTPGAERKTAGCMQMTPGAEQKTAGRMQMTPDAVGKTAGCLQMDSSVEQGIFGPKGPSPRAEKGAIGRHLVIGLICLVAPLVCLGAATFAIKRINYRQYGEFAVTDRNDTYYSDVISDLFHVDDGDQSLLIWLSRDGLEKAFEASPTLAEAKPYIDRMYEGSWAVLSDGEMHGDNLYWALREAVEAGGLYEQGGEAVNEYYRKIHEELTAAFEDGRLPKDTKSIYISSGGRGMTVDEMRGYFPLVGPRAVAMMIRYQNNVTSAAPATGDEEHVRRMAEMLGSPYVVSDGSNAPDFDFGISFAVEVTAFYSKIGILVTALAAMGYALAVFFWIVGLFKGKSKDYSRGPLLLVLAGMGLSGALYTFAILWFCSWHTLELAYEYLGGVMLIMNVLQALGVALLVVEVGA
ncbi:MAG: hypothetical protein Q4A32_12190, partial [Lachnospiraceae bacterium]|nr:hypothetical protein [Lachnospiraceae bacterium]